MFAIIRLDCKNYKNNLQVHTNILNYILMVIELKVYIFN